MSGYDLSKMFNKNNKMVFKDIFDAWKMLADSISYSWTVIKKDTKLSLWYKFWFFLIKICATFGYRRGVTDPAQPREKKMIIRDYNINFKTRPVVLVVIPVLARTDDDLSMLNDLILTLTI